MSRTTKAEVEAVFARLCATAGVPIGGKFDRATMSNSEGWSLDYAPCYGGYAIAGHSGDGTGESRPLGELRMPAGEFVRAMHFAIRAIDGAEPKPCGYCAACGYGSYGTGEGSPDCLHKK